MNDNIKFSDRYVDVDANWESPPEGGGLPVSNSEFIRNIRANCRLDLPNLKSEPEHDKIMVMVCGGPTAKLYLDEIKRKSNDPNYRIFCSNNTHDWLIENGIKPYCQFIIDPKENKKDDVKKPQKDVLYMIGVQCNPQVFENLKGYNLKRILTYCGVGKDDGSVKDYEIIRAHFDEDEYAPLDGGTMAGLRAMTLARVLGYLTVEFYGFDSCFFETDEKGEPVYYSFEKKRKENILEIQTDDGRMFLSTPVFASQARQFIKWKHQLAWIKFIIHGDSLTASINKIDDEVWEPKHNLLITDYHLKLCSHLHNDNGSNVQHYKSFGSTGHEYAGQIAVLAGQLIKRFGDLTLLDYGCGKKTFLDTFPPLKGLSMSFYDPAIKEHNKRPEPSDIVVCTDVLEHVEPECIENVLDDLKNLTKKVCFCAVSTRKANKFYSDGKNAHLIVEDFEWWYPRLRQRFDVVESKIIKGNKFISILQSKEMRGINNGYHEKD
ncbi:MAG: 6-hydroxymethylpterin diphosphokinase MptE-like protein [Thermotogota bacterium]|nr:6-hydroxymethylpterin diphosphokinase MptE-like protein [Thermotogota bacterium]